MIALGGWGLSLVVGVWTSRSRALSVSAGFASSAFVPKREKGRKNEDLAPRSATDSFGSLDRRERLGLDTPGVW